MFPVFGVTPEGLWPGESPLHDICDTVFRFELKTRIIWFALLNGFPGWSQAEAALAVGEGGQLLIEMMSASSSNGTGGTETLEPRSRPPNPEAQE